MRHLVWPRFDCTTETDGLGLSRPFEEGFFYITSVVLGPVAIDCAGSGDDQGGRQVRPIHAGC
jgi:hypothetical protein